MQRQGNEWPLVFFTLLTQMSVGIFTISGLVAIVLPKPNLFTEYLLAIFVLGFTLLALVSGALAATSHLNSPPKARFSLNNLRNSWLSREAFLGSIFGLLVFVLMMRRWLESEFGLFDTALTLIGIACGLNLVYTISRLYMLRTVPAWNHWGTLVAFFTSTFLLGTSGIIFQWLMVIFWADAYASDSIMNPMLIASDLLIFSLVALQFGNFVFTLIFLNSRDGKAAESVSLLWTDFKTITFWRWAIAFGAVGLLLWRQVTWGSIFSLIWVFVLILISEILGRYLFYAFYRREGI